MEKNTALNAETPNERLESLRGLWKRYENGELPIPGKTNNVNNHIHTCYSFSPYSPTNAVFTAWTNGLDTAGIMDHDSVAGCREFIEAGSILNMATTIGFECRCSVAGSPFVGKYINNPDQPSVAYVTCHGIPHQNIDAAQQWLTPYREKRAARILGMAEKINKLLDGSGLALNFDDDIVPVSQYKNGGTITERHLLYALAAKIIGSCSDGSEVVSFLKNQFNLDVTGKNLKILQDGFDGEHYAYYLLGILKSELTEQFYIEATDECPDITTFVKFAKQIGAIPAYPYLGDVAESVTGDKKAQIFEDSFLDELVPWVKSIGFDAITYMPTRNTAQQLKRLMDLCEKYDMFQISGEDINTPFQSFICDALRDPNYKHLIVSTWALIGHEKAATINLNDGMLTDETRNAFPSLQQRIEHFAEIGKQ